MRVGCKKYTITRGAPICISNKGADAIYFVYYGRACCKKYINQSWVNVNFYQTGDFFGEYSYLLGRDKPQSNVKYVAITESVVVSKIPFNYLNFLFHKNPSLASKFFKLLAYQFSEVMAFQISIPNNPKIPESYLNLVQQLIHTRNQIVSSSCDYEEESNPLLQSLLCKLRLPNEVILGHYSCKINRDLRSGIFVISTRLIVVANTLFGHVSSQFRIPFDSISNFQLRTDHCLEIVFANHQSIAVHLNSPQVTSEVLQLLGVLMEQTKFTKMEPSLQSSTDVDYSMELTLAEWDVINEFGIYIEFNEGDVLIRQGEPCNFLFRLCSGICSLFRTAQDQREDDSEPILISEKKVGDFCGEIGFLYGVYAFTLSASTSGSYWRFDKEAIKRLAMHQPVLGAKFYHKLASGILTTVFLTEESCLKGKG